MKADDRYLRGLFKSLQELSRLSHEFEAYGAQILPYQVTKNAVMLKALVAVEWMLEKFGFWSHVENEDIVTVAVIVDRNELAWQLMKVSTSIKIL